MDTANPSRPDARSQAEDRFAKIIKRDAEVKAYQKQQTDAEAVKIARLRALRLAKEADEEAKPKKSASVRRSKPAKETANGAD